MSETRDRRLMRLIHGELPPEEASLVRRELSSDPAAQARLAELEEVWEGLELPVPGAGASVLDGVRDRLEGLASGETRAVLWGSHPGWRGAVAAVALGAGIGIGAWLGSIDSGLEVGSFEVEPSLAESYWTALDAEGSEALWGSE